MSYIEALASEDLPFFHPPPVESGAPLLWQTSLMIPTPDYAKTRAQTRMRSGNA